jgi:hypothetical protein
MRKRIGKLQRQCRRAFWASDASELPTSALVAWCYVRSPRPLATWQREAICRAVRRWADRPSGQSGVGVEAEISLIAEPPRRFLPMFHPTSTRPDRAVSTARRQTVQAVDQP